jgi:FMN phosphatase YigB (HAD superfamily)
MTFRKYYTEGRVHLKPWLERRDNAYVFDVDDTLVTTGAMIIVKDENGNLIKKITPHDYNTYKKQPGEQFDFSEFQSADIFRKTAQPTKYFKIIKNISDAVNRGDSDSAIYILTARGSKIKETIHDYLESHDIYVRSVDITTLGDRTDAPIAEIKKNVLQKIRNKHIGNVVFFDDDEKNIELANQVPGIQTRLV